MSSKSSDSAVSGNSKQRRQISPSVHWCFTLNNYTADDIKDIQNYSSIKRYIFQEETGKCGTPHLQGYIEFKKKVRPMSILNNKIHWEKTKNVNASIAYCSKSDTRSGEIFSNFTFDEELILLNEDNLYEWQKQILKEISIKADDRKIIVYVDKQGGKGKTQLCKLLCAKYNALCVSGKSSDMKYAIVKFKEINGFYPKIILFDVPRCNVNYISYDGLEKIKDGLFFCGKYESCQVIMNCPHIYMFMNEDPDTDMCSADRWCLRRL